ncbi:hypothetical protein D3C71_2080740 [compost metagenome]
MARIISKVDIAPIIDRIILIVKDGAISGNVMFLKDCHFVVPSIYPASYKSFGTDCSPARKISIE